MGVVALLSRYTGNFNAFNQQSYANCGILAALPD